MTLSPDIPRFVELADLVTPMCLRAAATVRLADHIEDGHDSVETLAHASGCRPRPLGKLVDHLCALGLLDRDPAGRLTVTDFGRPLCASWGDDALRSFLDLDHISGRAEMAITGLVHTLRTGRSAYEGVYGTDLWSDVDRRPEASCGIETFAAPAPGLDAHLLIDEYDWSPHRHVVDVGGNNGALLAAILSAHPQLRGTLVDLPTFAARGTPTFHARGVAERARVAPGSFFDPLPTGGDVYLLSAILADWSDRDAARILERCAQAAAPDGYVVVAEVHAAGYEDLPPPQDTAMSVRFETSVTEPDRTPDDVVALAGRAGLDLHRRGGCTAMRSVLEFRPRAGAGR